MDNNNGFSLAPPPDNSDFRQSCDEARAIKVLEQARSFPRKGFFRTEKKKRILIVSFYIFLDIFADSFS